jgi:hypothetical protein
MTLVELLVALAVTSILLVGLGGVLFNVSGHYQSWVDRIGRAATGPSLAASLQADSHRYVVCDGFNHDNPFLDLCPPGAMDPASYAVRYEVSDHAPYVITRQAAGKPAVLVVRSASTSQPYFWADCLPGGDTISGHIHVYRLRVDDGEGNVGGNASPANFSVYYSAPLPRGGCG